VAGCNVANIALGEGGIDIQVMYSRDAENYGNTQGLK